MMKVKNDKTIKSNYIGKGIVLAAILSLNAAFANANKYIAAGWEFNERGVDDLLSIADAMDETPLDGCMIYLNVKGRKGNVIATRTGGIFGEEEWDYSNEDYPKRTITKIGSVVEVSAVTFPAYDSTYIDARSQEALENAKATLERAKEQRAESVETEDNTLALAKARYKFNSI